jgi:cytochrome P450
LLDRLADRSEFDLLAEFAGPLPVEVIAELLGVPVTDRHLLRPWSNAIVKMYEYDRPAALEAAARLACDEFDAYLRWLAGQRRAEPRDDLVSGLVVAEGLSEDELVANCILLLNAGHEASVNTLGNGMLGLFRHPAELARLRADPDTLLPTAVEELIRYDSPLQLFERTAYDDIEVGGVTVRSGQKIAALLGSANRDPAVFADPARTDVGRDPNPHLGFGAGLHFCLGAPLARLELTVSLPTLLRRMPRLELAEEPDYHPNFVIRGLRSLRVRCR